MNEVTDKKLLALTFDDGPEPRITPLVLDRLEKYGVVATFFPIGQNISEASRPIMERQIRLGCEMGNHSFTHSFMDQFTAEEIRKEIQDSNDMIKKMTGVTPKFFRPPYIITNDVMYDNIDLPFICGVGCNDWEMDVTAEQRAKTLLTTLKDGDIILLHDLTDNIPTVEALDQIIPELMKRGFTFVTLSKLFELKGVNPNVRHKIWTNIVE